MTHRIELTPLHVQAPSGRLLDGQEWGVRVSAYFSPHYELLIVHTEVDSAHKFLALDGDLAITASADSSTHRTGLKLLMEQLETKYSG